MQGIEANGDAEIDAAITTAAADGYFEQDDRSSSLSEPVEDEEEEELHNGVEKTAGAAQHLSTQQSLDVDSEAETERLDQTPEKLRQQAEAIKKTPSKLSHAATADDELSEPPSPVPIGPGAASSTGTIETASACLQRGYGMMKANSWS